MILHTAIPQHPILPQEPKRHGNPYTLWHPHLVCPRYARCPDARCPSDVLSEPKSTSTSLLLVNKAMSAEVQRIIQQNVVLVIEVGAPDSSTCKTTSVYYLSTTIYLGYCTGFRYSLTQSDIRPLQTMRNFEIAPTIGRDDYWWFAETDSNRWGKASHLIAEQRDEYTEKVRLICDALAAYNDNIQQLAIRLPCLCNLLPPEIPLAISRAATHEKTTAAPFLEALEANFGGKLIGEELSPKEKIWRDIKTMARVPCEIANNRVDSQIFNLWEHQSKPDFDFEAEAMKVKETMLRLLEEEKRSGGGEELSGPLAD
ncbi:MAG: hypothetical protein LQ339_006886 [Xanthoria mediterranea]|nr:MAG: hypothetical protein LQ339_006886 [Xanthoria mediterranea]